MYWGDVGEYNYVGFKGAIRPQAVCPSRCALTTRSRVSRRYRVPPALYPSDPAPFPSGNHHVCEFFFVLFVRLWLSALHPTYE